MSFYVRNPSKAFLNKILGLIPNNEEMKYIAGLDNQLHSIDFRIGTSKGFSLKVGFVLLPAYDKHYESEGLKEVKENDVTLRMVREALGIGEPVPVNVPASTPKQSVLAWGYKNKKTGKLRRDSHETRDLARTWQETSDKIIRVRITEV